MSENDLSRKIRELRALHGLTLEQVAQQVGVGRSTIRKWETGMIENMRRDKIAKLAAALRTTPGYLMGWEDEQLLHAPSSLFKKLKAIRKARGYSAQKVAEGIGISESNYLSIENGSDTDCMTLVHMAHFFCCTTDYLLSIDGDTGEDKQFLVEWELLQKFRQLTPESQDFVMSALNLAYQKESGEETNSAPKEA